MSVSLNKNYELAGYHYKQNLGIKPALLLVDFADAYFIESSPIYGGELCEIARRLGRVGAYVSRTARY